MKSSAVSVSRRPFPAGRESVAIFPSGLPVLNIILAVSRPVENQDRNTAAITRHRCMVQAPPGLVSTICHLGACVKEKLAGARKERHDWRMRFAGFVRFLTGVPL